MWKARHLVAVGMVDIGRLHLHRLRAGRSMWLPARCLGALLTKVDVDATAVIARQVFVRRPWLQKCAAVFGNDSFLHLFPGLRRWVGCASRKRLRCIRSPERQSMWLASRSAARLLGWVVRNQGKVGGWQKSCAFLRPWRAGTLQVLPK